MCGEVCHVHLVKLLKIHNFPSPQCKFNFAYSLLDNFHPRHTGAIQFAGWFLVKLLMLPVRFSFIPIIFSGEPISTATIVQHYTTIMITCKIGPSVLTL